MKVNPLATGGATLIPDEAQYIEKEMNELNGNEEMATVDVENFEFKEEFGQLMGVSSKKHVE